MLLFDENLSPKLVTALGDVFPDSAHVDRVGLGWVGYLIMRFGNMPKPTALFW